MPITQQQLESARLLEEAVALQGKSTPRDYGEWYKLGHDVNCQCDVCKRTFGEIE